MLASFAHFVVRFEIGGSNHKLAAIKLDESVIKVFKAN